MILFRMVHMQTKELKEILSKAGNECLFPISVACPVGCKFCYLLGMKKIIPSIELETIPEYDDETFNYFYNAAVKQKKPVQFYSPFRVKDKRVLYGFSCDFFNLGLSLRNIESLLELNRKHKGRFIIYTTALNIDKGTAEYLTQRYSSVFSFWFSVVTFNEQLKRRIMMNFPASERLKEALKPAAGSKIFLIHFNLHQTIDDLRILNNLKLSDAIVMISELYHNKCHSPLIKSLARKSHDDFKKLIFYLMTHQSEFSNISSFRFYSPPEAYAWRHRFQLQSMISEYNLREGDVALCSKAAFSTLSFIIGKRALVVAVDDSFEGSISFTTTLTADNIRMKINELRQGRLKVKRIFIPSSIWWIDYKYDLQGNTVECLQKQFPEVEIIVINVPSNIIVSMLSLEDCYDYYACDFNATHKLFNNKDVLQRVLEQSKGQQESITPAHCLRKLSVVVSEKISESAYFLQKRKLKPPAEKDKDKGTFQIGIGENELQDIITSPIPAIITYYQPFAVLEDKAFLAECTPIIINGRKRMIRKGRAYQITLKNESSKFFFYKLFLEHKSLQLAAHEAQELYGTGAAGLLKDITNFYMLFKNLEYASEKKDL